MDLRDLEANIERHFTAGTAAVGDAAALEVFYKLRTALESGEVRSASPDSAAD